MAKPPTGWRRSPTSSTKVSCPGDQTSHFSAEKPLCPLWWTSSLAPREASAPTAPPVSPNFLSRCPAPAFPPHSLPRSASPPSPWSEPPSSQPPDGSPRPCSLPPIWPALTAPGVTPSSSARSSSPARGQPTDAVTSSSPHPIAPSRNRAPPSSSDPRCPSSAASAEPRRAAPRSAQWQSPAAASALHACPPAHDRSLREQILPPRLTATCPHANPLWPLLWLLDQAFRSSSLFSPSDGRFAPLVRSTVRRTPKMRSAPRAPAVP